MSVALSGLEAVPVTVEATVSLGLQTGPNGGVTVLGVHGTTANQSAERVRAGLISSGCDLSGMRILVNLLPAELQKTGSGFDLSIAVAIHRALGLSPPSEDIFLGEVSTHGRVQGVRGVLPSLKNAVRAVVPRENIVEAKLACSGEVRSLDDLSQLSSGFESSGDVQVQKIRDTQIDMSDVFGQIEARRALEIAAAGAHHIMLIGPPGTGKSMLARRLPTILPSLSEEEAIDVTSIRSYLSTPGDIKYLSLQPPFAAPHHCASMPALLGGGTGATRPGSITRAHNGVLFLDEIFEWSPRTLDGLRQPLQDGYVTISRAAGQVSWPANTQLVAAGNPCPCGPQKAGCRCRQDQIERYRSKLSGPLVDRFDLAPPVERASSDELVTAERGESSAVIRTRVENARLQALERQNKANAVASSKTVRSSCSAEAVRVLAKACDTFGLSARGFDRALRVARTIADLAGEEIVKPAHSHEALIHRMRLDSLWKV